MPIAWHRKGHDQLMEILSLSDGTALDIDRKETFRYLGYHFGGTVSPDPELEKLVDELTAKIKKVITPRCVYEIYSLENNGDACRLYHKAGEQAAPDCLFKIDSKKLAAHLKDCDRVILFAATVGPGADTIIRRYSAGSSLKPAILQAAGASAIEAYADLVTDGIRKDFPNLKMRFSPGYGDFSLEHQKDFFRMLDIEKNLGISLNDALLMTPTKSITAVIGVLPDT